MMKTTERNYTPICWKVLNIFGLISVIAQVNAHNNSGIWHKSAPLVVIPAVKLKIDGRKSLNTQALGKSLQVKVYAHQLVIYSWIQGQN